MAGNNRQFTEIKRLASELAFQFRRLVIDESTAQKFQEQSVAKADAEEKLLWLQEEITKLEQIFSSFPS